MSGIGILGGTFNPVHNGHLRHALEAGEALGLDRVLLLPCAEPPHKGVCNVLPFALRVDMLQAAVSNIPLLEVDPLEGELARPSYTWRTLEEWNRRHIQPGGALPYFMMGAESFAALSRWKRGLELPRFAHLVMLPRDGEDGRGFYESIRRFWPGSLEEGRPFPVSRETVALAGGGACTFLPAPRLDISSTFIRERWCAGRSVAGLVPEAALRVLEAHAGAVRRIWP
ncbi:nicotinate (nicotinamide) nucleotide adenylyltransferase [uncultured Mailhella sp.]|uniref:nicotinate (nicotinamide) nucleotide adenylyltransferase n=1 Tax=uncultured Mailhella sp. TaxID=1981031 RepID=UPI0026056960|nr:nicotinate (nicotinamide) nucleotide adenylyltransferase [uncultured Mailhella sp.]